VSQEAETAFAADESTRGMPEKKQIPPQDVIREDSGPPVTEITKPKPTDVQIDIDDAQIEEPEDDAFKKGDKGH